MGRKAIKPLIPVTEEDRERDKKYAAFRRNDIHILMKSKMFLWYIPFSFIRLFIPYFSIALMCVFTYLCTFFKTKEQNFSGLSYKIIRGFQIVSARLTMLAGGYTKINEIYLDYDYRKYLGPDWKYDKNK